MILVLQIIIPMQIKKLVRDLSIVYGFALYAQSYNLLKC